MVSPKFVPDNILQIDDVPKTLNGKKLEVPIRKILLGFNPDKVLNYDSMSNPESVKYFIELAKELNKNDKNPIM
jgi:Acyl-coenzyme A synthetases/AMP-(fatty) acid ligases